MKRRLCFIAALAALALCFSCNNSGTVDKGAGDGTLTDGEVLNPGQSPTGIKAPAAMWGWWYSTEGVPLTLSGQNFLRYQCFYVAEERLYAATSAEYQARSSGVAPAKYYAYRSYSEGKLVTDAVSVSMISDGKGGWLPDQVRISYKNKSGSLLSYDALRTGGKGGFSGTVKELAAGLRALPGERALVVASGVSLVLTNVLNKAEAVSLSSGGDGEFTTPAGSPLTIGDPYRLSAPGLDSYITVFPSFNAQNIGLAVLPNPAAGYTYSYKASWLPGRRLDNPNLRSIKLQVLKSGIGGPKKLRVSISCPDNRLRFLEWGGADLPSAYSYPLAGESAVPELISYEVFFDISGQASGILKFPVRVVMEDDREGDGTWNDTWDDRFDVEMGTELYTVFLSSNSSSNEGMMYIDDYMLNGQTFPTNENRLKGTITSDKGFTTSFQASLLNYDADKYAWIEGPGDPYRFVVHYSRYGSAADSKRYSIGIDAMPYLWTSANSTVDPPDLALMPADNGPGNPMVLVPGTRCVFSIGTGDFHYFSIDVNPGATGSIAPPEFSVTDSSVEGPLNLSLSAPSGTPAGSAMKYALVWEGPQYIFRSGIDDSQVFNFLKYQYLPASAITFDPASPVTNANRGSIITISAWIEAPDGSGGSLQSPRSVKRFEIRAPKPSATLVSSPTTGASYLVLTDAPLDATEISYRDNLSGSGVFTSYSSRVSYEISAAATPSGRNDLKMTEAEGLNRIADADIKGFLVRMAPDGATAGTMQVWAKAKREVTRTIGDSTVTYNAYEESYTVHCILSPDGAGGWRLVSE